MAKEHFYKIETVWTGNKGDGTKDYRAYSRAHEIFAEGKQPIAGSSDPVFNGDSLRYNPEELLVSAVSACHLLWYLHLCSVAEVVVVEYKDKSIGTMVETSDGGGHFTEILLKPQVTITKDSDAKKALELHQKAHKLCFIANSLNFPVRNEPEILFEN